MRKLIYLVCMIGWSIVCGMTIILMIEGRRINPVTVLIPSLGCLLHFVEKIFAINIKEDEKLMEEIMK